MGLVRWLWRHKRSVAVVSVAAAGAYTAYRLWRRGRSLEELLLEQLLGAAAADGGGGAAAATRRSEERLHEHFRVTQRECDALLERHVAALRAQVQSQLDPKPVRARMRAEGSEADGSGGWRELKVLGFARAVGSVYVLALLAPRLRVRLNIVARHYLAEREASGGVLAGPEKGHARELVREQRGRPREHGRLGRRPTVARAR